MVSCLSLPAERGCVQCGRMVRPPPQHVFPVTQPLDSSALVTGFHLDLRAQEEEG
jgi:hypothetical protein